MDNSPATLKPCIAIDTNGWDTVYAIRFPDVNEAIKKNKSSPSGFSQQSTDSDGTIRIQGTFSDWQLTTGGDNSNLWMHLPIPSAVFEFSGNTNQLVNISAIVEINLVWLSDGVLQNLGPDNSVGSVSVNTIDFGINTLSDSRKSLFKPQLENWLKSNISSFRHTFASLIIDNIADKDNFTWLRPTGKPSYAVTDAGDGSDITKSVFAIMSMTGNTPSPQTHEISPFAIPDGSNSCLLLRPQKVLANMFKPTVHLIFDRARPEQFDLDNNGFTITNNQKLSFGEQKLDNGNVVNPSIDEGNFKLTLQDCKLTMELTDMSFNWSPGITVHINHGTHATIGMTTANQLSLNILSSHTDAVVQTSTGVLIAEMVGIIAGAILGAVLGGIGGAMAEGGAVTIADGSGEAVLGGIEMGPVAGSNTEIALTDEAIGEALNDTEIQLGNRQAAPSAFRTFFARPIVKFLAGAIASGLVGSLAVVIVEVLKDVAENQGQNIPTLDKFGKEALKNIIWPNTTKDGFTLKSVELNGALQLGIQLQFNKPPIV